MNADKQIKEILERYEEDPRTATWKVQSATVIYHKALERIAAKAGIYYERPEIIRSERDEAVVLVTGHIPLTEDARTTIGGTRSEWSIGEALVNVNYRVSGKQAAYVYAMAEKRAKDRVILKLIGLHGLLYSEEEADDFKQEAPVVVPPVSDDSKKLYISVCRATLRSTISTYPEKVQWWNSEEQKKQRRDFLNQDEVNELKAILLAQAPQQKEAAE
jgi:hypothetical protein